MAALVSAIAVRRRTGSLASIGLKSPVRWWHLLLAVAITTVATAITANLAEPFFASHLGYSARATERLTELKGNFLATVLTIVGLGWITAALGEEIVFRGTFLLRLRVALGNSKTAVVAAFVVQALLFGSVHLYQGWAGAAMATVIALLFGGAVVATNGNLWPAILVHAIPDTITIIRAFKS